MANICDADNSGLAAELKIRYAAQMARKAAQRAEVESND